MQLNIIGYMCLNIHNLTVTISLDSDPERKDSIASGSPYKNLIFRQTHHPDKKVSNITKEPCCKLKQT